ncbi:MAG TPA: right-handed parallel beta-helix repeat-containing protein, partial [Vicinamibacterales bacterium]|nr:right-handed parallel beta-helix repeat-containing protein [Vicinamibacterales bacterium]
MRILLGAFGDSQVTISPTISGNTISNMTSEGISLLVAAAASSSAQMTIQPSITGNSLATVGDVAIGVPASLLGRGNVNVDFSPTISNNTISEANNGGIALTWALRGGTSSIPFSTRTPRTAQGLEATLRPKPTQAPGGTLTSNALIDGNKVQPPGPSGNGSANGPGIDLFYPDLSDWQNLNVDWTISNNTIRTVHRDGIAVSNSSASSSSISSASASRRPITASAIAANAISKSDAFNSDSGSFNLTIAGNTVSDAGDSGVVVSLFETSLSSVQQSMLINNNSISGAAAAGILISISGSTMSSDLIDVNQNTVTANQTGMAVFQGSLAPGGVNPMLLRCNTITGNSGDGIAVTSTNSQLPDFGGGNLASPGNNQIFGNGDHVTTFDFNNGSAVTAQAQNNYWGSATGPVPATQISGPVNFTPFLTGPPTACAVVTPPATHFGVTAPASATAGSPFTITVTALDASNNPVPTYTGTVHFTSSDPLAALPPNSSLTAGSGTFTVTLATPGTQSITATDTVTSSITGTSNLIAVSAGPATHYSVVAPAGASPGTPFTFTVTALDAFNNVATGYTGTVHFTSTDASATLPANSTLSSGVGSFTATLITPPSQTITATDTSNPSITGTSNSIALSAAVADVAITKVGPPSAIPGSDVTFTITVKNNGPSVASNVVVSDPTPARLTFVSLTGPCSGFPCTIGSMNSGQIVTLFAKYSVQPGPTATVANTATVTTTASDPNPSNNSATARFVTGCPTAAPTLLGPANGTSGVAVNGTLSWTNVDAAVYTVYLDVQGPNACSKFFASTTATSVQFAGLQPGTTYQWRVVASAAGCADKSSQCQTFTTASACPTTGPVLIAPLGGTVEDSVTYSWTAVPGARDYQLFVNDQPVGTTTSTSFGPTKVENGPISWSVVAEFDPPCAPLSSAPVTFNGCDTGATTIPSIYGQLDSAYAYDLTWDPIVGASRYEVDEADNPTFTNATTQTTTGTALQFQHPVTTPTAFYYRVRGFIDCANAFGHNSVVVRIVLAPITSPGNPNVSIPAGSDKLVSIIVHIAGIPNGTFPFTASLDPQQPWLVSVTPASGTLPPEGLDLTVLADPTALANGTHTGTVHVIVTTPSSGPIVANGVTPVGVPVSVSLVSPITPKPGGMPPPNSLIIPSTGHLDGVNSQWASDIRVLNTASQTVHYQLTFTPDDPSQSVRQTVIQVNAGATMALDDVVKTWYGIGSLGESSNGALEIRPLDNPSKGTPDDTTPSVSFTTVASSRTYNAATTSNTASFGEFIPATPFANFVGKALDTSHPATVLGLQQIAQNDAMRTNLGVMEASGQPAQILISVFDSAGNKLLDTPMNLAAFQHAQLNGFLAQNHITLPDGRIEVQVTGGDGKITAYASVIDNKSGDPILVSGVPLGQSSFDNFVLPGVADLNTGLAAWRTDMRIFNPTATPQNTTLTFYPASGDPQSTSITVNPGEVKQLDNTLSSVFGATNTGGTIHVTTAAPAPLVV